MSPSRAPARGKSKKAKANAIPPPPPRRFNPHHLVPPHQLLGDAQAPLKALASSVERLPKILVTDPGLKTDPKFVSAREAREPLNGRIVRVRRPSSPAGLAVAYRVLIQNLGE